MRILVGKQKQNVRKPMLVTKIALLAVLRSKYWKIEEILRDEEAFIFKLSVEFQTFE